MDRTAWIVIILCVIGLVGWEWWLAKHPPPRPLPATTAVSPTPAALASNSPSATTSVAPVPAPTATPTATSPAAPAFAEKTETLRNEDVELHLTNRGGG